MVSKELFWYVVFCFFVRGSEAKYGKTYKAYWMDEQFSNKQDTIMETLHQLDEINGFILILVNTKVVNSGGEHCNYKNDYVSYHNDLQVDGNCDIIMRIGCTQKDDIHIALIAKEISYLIGLIKIFQHINMFRPIQIHLFFNYGIKF